MGEQDLGSRVDAVGAEHPVRGREGVERVEKGHLHGAELERTCRG